MRKSKYENNVSMEVSKWVRRETYVWIYGIKKMRILRYAAWQEAEKQSNLLRRRIVIGSIQQGHQEAEQDYLSHQVIKSKRTYQNINCMYILYFILTGEIDF